MIPSVKTIQQIRCGGEPLPVETARAVRAAMEKAESCGYNFANPGRELRQALRDIDVLIGGCGVERIAAGDGQRSPAIAYVNLGDTYETTVMLIRGRFRIGSWGAVVESGNYQ
jgi:hypothetical protein